MRILAVLACVLLLASPSARAQASGKQSASQPAAVQQAAPAASSPKVDPAEEADIRQLLKVMGAEAIVRQTILGQEKDLRPLMTNSLPPGAYRAKLVDLFLQKFNSQATPEGLVNLAIPIYAQALSDQDIKGLIQFYETPLGQRASKALPLIEREIRVKANAWGRDLGRKTMEEVLSEHPELAKQLKEAVREEQQR